MPGERTDVRRRGLHSQRWRLAKRLGLVPLNFAQRANSRAEVGCNLPPQKLHQTEGLRGCPYNRQSLPAIGILPGKPYRLCRSEGLILISAIQRSEPVEPVIAVVPDCFVLPEVPSFTDVSQGLRSTVMAANSRTKPAAAALCLMLACILSQVATAAEHEPEKRTPASQVAAAAYVPTEGATAAELAAQTNVPTTLTLAAENPNLATLPASSYAPYTLTPVASSPASSAPAAPRTVYQAAAPQQAAAPAKSSVVPASATQPAATTVAPAKSSTVPASAYQSACATPDSCTHVKHEIGCTSIANGCTQFDERRDGQRPDAQFGCVSRTVRRMRRLLQMLQMRATG